MPYTEYEKFLIKHYHTEYGWGSRKILAEWGEGKKWSRGGIQKIIEKLDETGSLDRRPGSGRPVSVCNQKNIDAVESMVFSQEDPTTGEREFHEPPSRMAQRLGISRRSVMRIIYSELELIKYHRVKAQALNFTDNQKRIVRAKRMLRNFPKKSVLKQTFFSDEKIFTVEGMFNPQNDVFYAKEKKKCDVPEERVCHSQSAFPKCVMVSAAVSMLGRTSLYIIEPGVRVDSDYYCNSLLSEMIPEMNELSGGTYTFQQDGARAHTSKYSLKYFKDTLPSTANLLQPEDWPPHSPDLNPMDYGVWSLLARHTFKVKIRDIDHLYERLGQAWAEMEQEAVDRIILAFPKRLKACIEAEGKRFEYKLKKKSAK